MALRVCHGRERERGRGERESGAIEAGRKKEKAAWHPLPNLSATFPLSDAFILLRRMYLFYSNLLSAATPTVAAATYSTYSATSSPAYLFDFPPEIRANERKAAFFISPPRKKVSPRREGDFGRRLTFPGIFSPLGI
jgi:SRSO17 transposase